MPLPRRIVLTALLLLAPDLAAADTAAPGVPVPGLALSLMKEPDGMVLHTLSDPEGRFAFAGLPRGTYTLFVDDAAALPGPVRLLVLQPEGEAGSAPLLPATGPGRAAVMPAAGSGLTGREAWHLRATGTLSGRVVTLPP